MIVTKVNSSFAQIISELGRKTFYDTWNHENNEIDMQSYLEEAFSIKSIKQQLNNPECFFYVIRIEEKCIGYLKLNVGKAQTEFQKQEALEIEKIYFLKQFQGKKIANLFMETSLNLASELNKKVIWLGVSERNSRALAFYQRHGFIVTGKHTFMIGETLDKDLIMEKIL